MIRKNTLLPEAENPPKSSYWTWVILAIIILSTIIIRARLLDVPLERDEGEYAYAGQLILQGIPPYSQVYNMKLPGIYAAYAVILAVFGQTHTAIHLGLLIINIATVFLLFLLGKRLFDNTVGLVGAAAFALLSLSRPVQGIFANAEHFVILPAIGGILLLLCAIDSNKKTLVFVSGLLLGLAFLMKQHAIAFILFAGVYLFISEIRRKPLSPSSVITKCLFFAVGVLIPFAVTCLILYKAGVFDKFWFWTFDYASQYVSSVSLSAGLKRLGQVMSMIIKSTFLIWFLAGAGVVGFLCKTGCRRKWLFALGFLFY